MDDGKHCYATAERIGELMRYFIGSTAVIDNIHFIGHPDKLDLAGGAGIYALCGSRLWATDVNLVCGVGTDYVAKFGSWFRDNLLSMQYLHVLDAATPVTDVYYRTEGDRSEIPKYGVEHYHQFEFSEVDFLSLVKQDCGIYVFRNTDPYFWKRFLNTSDVSAKIMWEIAGDACKPEFLQSISMIAKRIDILSLNMTEAKQIFAIGDESEIIKNLRALGTPLIFLRLGKRGQMLITEDENVFVPSIKGAKIVDVTGGGNSSSGAALVGYCENRPLTEIGQMANLAAIMCLSQYGVPKNINRFKAKIDNRMQLKS